jgi:hypothetical protein
MRETLTTITTQTLKMDSATINFILNSSKEGKHINLHDDSLRPIISYLKEDQKAIRLYGNNLILTEIGEEILRQNGWDNYLKNIDYKEEIKLRKTKVDLELAEKMLKEFKITKFFAWGGFIIGILLLLKEVYLLFKE